MVNFDQQDIDLFLSSVKTNIKKEAWVILANDKVIILRSGKGLWSKRSYAKSALNNHISCIMSKINLKYNNLGLQYREEVKKSYIQFLENNGIVKFIKL